MQETYLVTMAKQDGDFDNFTYVNSNHMSALEQASSNQPRHQTEMVIAKQSFVRSFAGQEDESTEAAAA